MLTANGPSLAPVLVVAHQTSLGRPDPEVTALPASPARARRRHFTAADKLPLLHEADHTAIGQLGALLRREGLYSSHLANWRHQRAQGTLNALAPQRRGRPVMPAAEREVAPLRAENARLARKLAAAETVIAVQKKVATLLGLLSLDPPELPESLEQVRTPDTLSALGTTVSGRRS